MMVNVAQLAHITMIFLGSALIPSLIIEQISLIQDMDVAVGRVWRAIPAKRRFERMTFR